MEQAVPAALVLAWKQKEAEKQ